MQHGLRVAHGACSQAGRKPVNQDAHGGLLPEQPLRTGKGVAFAIADGISSSAVSDQASQLAISRFLSDYTHTPLEWSVKSSGQHALLAINSLLNAETFRSPYRFDKNRGFVCTFSALIIKARLVHIFHLGDTRIYRIRDGALQPLTEDHRFWGEENRSYLARALGMSPHPEIDYVSHEAKVDDLYVFMSDGVYDYLQADDILTLAATDNDLDQVCLQWVELAYQRGSTDNLTAMAVRVLALPEHDVASLYQALRALPMAPALEAGKTLDGYHILRVLHQSHRSQVYLARDEASGSLVVLKIPAMDLAATPHMLERFYLEEWIARRVHHRHVLRPVETARQRQYLYSVMHYVPGKTLKQWMLDHPQPSLEKVRHIIEQIANALEAFHRLEMVYQDLQPANILLDEDDNITLIDFGAVSVAGLDDMYGPTPPDTLPGSVQYAAPEQLLGLPASPQSDLFALGCITYQLLTGKLPYGTEVAKIRHGDDRLRLYYRDIRYQQPDFPDWMDHAIACAVHPFYEKRYTSLSEFVFDLRTPNPAFSRYHRPALLQRHPLAFWRGLSFFLACLVFALAGMLANQQYAARANLEQAAQKQCDPSRHATDC